MATLLQTVYTLLQTAHVEHMEGKPLDKRALERALSSRPDLLTEDATSNRFVLHHGPVTITIEGMPDTVLPESVTLDIGIHSHYVKGWREQVDGFAANFVALGGRETFPGVDPAQRFSCRSLSSDQGLEGKLILFPPEPPTSVEGKEEAVHAALARDAMQAAGEVGHCGRLLVGQGDGDTYDPLCSLPFGHDGTCKP